MELKNTTAVFIKMTDETNEAKVLLFHTHLNRSEVTAGATAMQPADYISCRLIG